MIVLIEMKVDKAGKSKGDHVSVDSRELAESGLKSGFDYVPLGMFPGPTESTKLVMHDRAIKQPER